MVLLTAVGRVLCGVSAPAPISFSHRKWDGLPSNADCLIHAHSTMFGDLLGRLIENPTRYNSRLLTCVPTRPPLISY